MSLLTCKRLATRSDLMHPAFVSPPPRQTSFARLFGCFGLSCFFLPPHRPSFYDANHWYLFLFPLAYHKHWFCRLPTASYSSQHFINRSETANLYHQCYPFLNGSQSIQSIETAVGWLERPERLEGRPRTIKIRRAVKRRGLGRKRGRCCWEEREKGRT